MAQRHKASTKVRIMAAIVVAAFYVFTALGNNQQTSAPGNPVAPEMSASARQFLK